MRTEESMKFYAIDIGDNCYLSISDDTPTLYKTYEKAQDLVERRNKIHQKKSKVIEVNLIFAESFSDNEKG